MSEAPAKKIRWVAISWCILVGGLVWFRPAWAQEDAPKDNPPKEDVNVWIGRLASEETRDQARDQLRDLGAEALSALVKSLHHADPVIRSESAFVLGRIGIKEAVPALIESLGDPQAMVRMKSAYALGEIADVRAIDPLLNVLSDIDAGVRANVCFALGQIGDARAARELVKALNDPDDNVRNYAASALGSTRDRRALPALEWVALNDKSNDVRALAAASLGGLGDLRVCPVLVKLLDDREDIVRGRAIESLLALVRERRGYDHRETEAKRAPSVARWKNWLKGQRLAPLDAQTPTMVYDWWLGKPAPKPVPGGEPPPDAELNLLGPPTPLAIPALTASSPLPTDAKLVSPEALAFFNAARQRFDAGDFAASAKSFEGCAKLAPASRTALFGLAEAFFRMDHLSEARPLFEELAKLKPVPEGINSGVVKLRLGTCLRRYGEIASASAALEEAVADATDTALMREAARQFVAMKQYARAKALLERAYNLSGGEAENARLLALFLLKVPDETLRDVAKGARYAEVAYTANAADERCVSVMADADWARGERLTAVERIEKALKAGDSPLLRRQLEEYRRLQGEAQKKPEELKPDALKMEEKKPDLPKEEMKPEGAVAPGN